jgi:hypothetical protein
MGLLHINGLEAVCKTTAPHNEPTQRVNTASALTQDTETRHVPGLLKLTLSKLS